MKKKILITTESLVMGGVETALLSLIKTLKKYDVEIDLFVLEKGILIDEFKKLTKVNIIEANVPKNKFIARIMKNFLCKSIYRKFQKDSNKKYDIAIAFYGINNYCDLYAAAANAKEKFIWVHNNFSELYKTSKYGLVLRIKDKFMNKKFKYFDKIVCVSKNTKESFKKVFKGYDDKLIVLNNIFDTSRLKNKNEKLETELKGKNKLIFIGRLAPIKNVSGLIEEFQKAILELNDTFLYIVGSGPEEKKLKNLVLQKNLESNVIFLGNQNNPFKYLNNADALVLTSKSEPYGMVLFEALAMNKYFISTDTGGAKEIFLEINKKNKNNGAICSLDNIHNEIIHYCKNKNKIIPDFDMNKANKDIEKQIKDIFKLT